jgi:hypothetical protein
VCDEGLLVESFRVGRSGFPRALPLGSQSRR